MYYYSKKSKGITMQKQFNETIRLLTSNEHFRLYASQLNDLKTYYSDPVRLLIMGEFSVGKSSIINSLLEQEILASSLVPTTALTTFIKYGADERMDVHYENGEIENFNLDNMTSWSSEREKSHQTKRQEVKYITLYINNPLLKKVVLIDSPGLNSGHHAHTNQTLNTLEMTDDIMMVFAYGKVGQITEQQTLKQLADKGYSPFGVINMMDDFQPEPKQNADEEIDFDIELEKYYAYEFAKLKPFVRKIIGVSASDALFGLPRETEEQKSYYAMSEFPRLHQEIDNISTNTEVKMKRFKERLQQFLNELSAEMSLYLASDFYKVEVKKIIDLQNILEENLEQFEQPLQNRQNKLRQQRQSLITIITKPKNFEHWILNGHTQIIQDDFPYIAMKIFMQTYNNYNVDLKKHLQMIKTFEKNVNAELGEPQQLFTRLRVDGQKMSLYRNQYKELKLTGTRLKNRAQQLNYELDKYKQLLDTNADSLEKIYQNQLKDLQKENTPLNKKINSQATLSNQMYKEHEKIVAPLQNLVALASMITFFEQEFSISTNNHFQFTHTEANYNLDKKKQSIDARLNKLKMPNATSEKWLHQFKFPKMLNTSVPKPKNYFFYSFRAPLGILAASTLATGIYFVANTVDWNEVSFNSDEDYYAGDSSFEADSTYESDEVRVNYLTYDSYFNHTDYVGIVSLTEDMTLYDDFEGLLTSEYAEAYSEWEVYQRAGDWYKIQQNKWLYLDQTDGFSYLPNYYVQEDTNQPVLGWISNAEYNDVYRSPNKNEIGNQLDPTENYSIYSITENQWVQVGDDAWVKLGSPMLFEQTALSASLNTSANPIQTGISNTDSIPIFSDSDRAAPVIGLLPTTPNEELAIYGVLNGDWVNIGDNAWVEADKYLTIDWTFYDNFTGETPSGSLTVTTPKLNIRQQASTESNMLAVVDEGDVLDVYEIDPSTGWYRVGESSWVSNKPELVHFTEHATSILEEPTESSIDLSAFASNIDYENELGYIEHVGLEKIPVYGQPTFDSLDLDYLYPGDSYNVFGRWEDNWYQLEANRWIYVDEETIKFFSN